VPWLSYGRPSPLGRLVAHRSPRWVTAGTVLAVGGTCFLVGVFALEGFSASALAELPDRAAAGQALVRHRRAKRRTT